VVESDLKWLAANDTPESDPWNNFEHSASNTLQRRFASTGGFTEDTGMLAVEGDEDLVGVVSWHTVQHGPTASCRALNVGISLLPDSRGKGYGSAAQRALADYLFDTKLIERVEATTDIENLAEQRALEKAGFTREGVIRHAQFRRGSWHDAILYSRLRGD
jgi:RimJ/RimL family protein N-acetyltransferase